MVAGVFSARMTPTTEPLSVRQFLSRPASLSGNVGVSLSGGGSRALTAGMGQLRALRKLTLHGQSLLAQVKALSVVSGGAWLGVPYVYLQPGGPSDTAYLGPWIEDQAALTPETLPRPRRRSAPTVGMEIRAGSSTKKCAIFARSGRFARRASTSS
jgi:hypothetical protein